MSVKIITVAKALPKYTRNTKDIIPYLNLWLADQEDRYRRKVVKIFENAGVDKRYSIMDAESPLWQVVWCWVLVWPTPCGVTMW